MKGERERDNVTRQLLREYIHGHPGVTFQILCRVFGSKESTLRYHLYYLMDREEIVERKSNGVNTYYSDMSANETTSRSTRQKGSLRNRRLLSIISENPGITRARIKRMIDLDPREISTGMAQILEQKLVWSYENGGEVHYEAVTRERVLDEVFVSLVRKLINGEIDEISFLRLKEEIDRQRGERS